MTMCNKSSKAPPWWIAVIAYRGIVSHVRACTSHEAAVQEIAKYLRKHHRYTGDNHLPTIADWVAEHEPDFDAQIVEQDEPVHDTDAAAPVASVIKQGQFIVISIESEQPSLDQYSAWLYEGSLDFNSAFPVRFGVGPSVLGAVNALADEHRADTA